jgi:hypothetical protein
MSNPIMPNGGNTSNHFLFLAVTGKGRSVALEVEAKRLGISYEELDRRMAPSDEQREQMMLQEEAEHRKEERRLQRVREAVWEAWSDDEDAFDRLHDALVSTVMDESPTRDQLKAVFMILPAKIIGLGISWSFDDTEVGDEMYQFIQDNKDAVLTRLAEK